MGITDFTADDWKRAALITIDVQNDFVEPGPAQVAGTAEALPVMARLVNRFRSRGLPIVHAIRLYKPDGSDAEPFRSEFVRDHRAVTPGTKGAELSPPLLPATAGNMDADALYAGQFQSIGASEWLMYKPRWSAFYKTPLEDHLRKLAVRTIVLCGCNLPNCPRATLFDASERDFNAVLAVDAVSQTSPERLADLARIGVATSSVAALLEVL